MQASCLGGASCRALGLGDSVQSSGFQTSAAMHKVLQSRMEVSGQLYPSICPRVNGCVADVIYDIIRDNNICHDDMSSRSHLVVASLDLVHLPWACHAPRFGGL